MKMLTIEGTLTTLIALQGQTQWQIVAFQTAKPSEMPTAAQAAARLATWVAPLYQHHLHDPPDGLARHEHPVRRVTQS